MTTTPVRTAPAAAAAPNPAPDPAPTAHTRTEDAVALVVGTFFASFGLYLLHSIHAVTGGTAGASLLVSYVVPVPFGMLFLAVNLPFFALAVRTRGWVFTVRSAIAVVGVSAFSLLHALALPGLHPQPVYAVLFGNLSVGIGILVLFRHRASLGGFNVLALLVQDRLGWRAGYVQMALDVTVVLVSATVVPLSTVLLSAVGAVVLNLVLAMNHRPDRYLG